MILFSVFKCEFYHFNSLELHLTTAHILFCQPPTRKRKQRSKNPMEIALTICHCW